MMSRFKWCAPLQPCNLEGVCCFHRLRSCVIKRSVGGRYGACDPRVCFPGALYGRAAPVCLGEHVGAAFAEHIHTNCASDVSGQTDYEAAHLLRPVRMVAGATAFSRPTRSCSRATRHARPARRLSPCSRPGWSCCEHRRALRQARSPKRCMQVLCFGSNAHLFSMGGCGMRCFLSHYSYQVADLGGWYVC